MLAALILFLIGNFLIFVNPILGLVPGILLILLSIVVFVFALLGRGIGAIPGIGSTKMCPDGRSKIPSDAAVGRRLDARTSEQRRIWESVTRRRPRLLTRAALAVGIIGLSLASPRASRSAGRIRSQGVALLNSSLRAASRHRPTTHSRRSLMMR